MLCAQRLPGFCRNSVLDDENDAGKLPAPPPPQKTSASNAMVNKNPTTTTASARAGARHSGGHHHARSLPLDSPTEIIILCAPSGIGALAAASIGTKHLLFRSADASLLPATMTWGEYYKMLKTNAVQKCT
jgi:hypothetical protein